MNLPAWCLLMAVLLLSTACGHDIEPGRTEESSVTVTGLTLTEVRQTPIGATRSVAGSISSDRSLLIARTAGQVLRIRIRAGDEVQAGQTLLNIAGNAGTAQLREAESAIAETRQALAASEAALTLANQTHARYRQLFDNQAVTPQEMDQISAGQEQAKRERQRVAASLERVLAARDAARSTADLNILQAPFAARVVRRMVDEGATVLPGTPLLELDRLDTWQVRAEIPESFASSLISGDSVTVEVPALGRSFTARLTEVQAVDPASHSFGIKAVPTEDIPLVAGLFARILLTSDAHAAILIPATALAERGQLSGVFTAQDGRLHWRLVRTGRQVGERVEILAGLRNGERIVTDGIQRAHDGALLEPQP